MAKFRSWAAHGPRQKLVPYEFDPGPIGAEEVEVAVEHCGLCHSDLSMLNNDWGFSQYPFVPGHEVMGRVVATGGQAKGVKVGDCVGVGWTAASCMHCSLCLSGAQQLCRSAQPTIVGHAGGFADRVRAHWAWTIPLPAALDASTAGPLLCGGITVFNPFVLYSVSPAARVGVLGIGGLGHMALKFANAWGCEVTAFTSSDSKRDEARSLGAHRVVSSGDIKSLNDMAGSLDLLLITANAPLEWGALIATLAPRGRMHVAGAVPAPIPVNAFDLIGSEREISGSPTGSPVDIARMLDFAARHRIAPQVERFPMSRANEALAHLDAGKARYRIILDSDFK
jgi:alcohol/geraniol dehydrogenase (NADP+)